MWQVTHTYALSITLVYFVKSRKCSKLSYSYIIRQRICMRCLSYPYISALLQVDCPDFGANRTFFFIRVEVICGLIFMDDRIPLNLNNLCIINPHACKHGKFLIKSFLSTIKWQTSKEANKIILNDHKLGNFKQFLHSFEKIVGGKWTQNAKKKKKKRKTLEKTYDFIYISYLLNLCAINFCIPPFADKKKYTKLW